MHIQGGYYWSNVFFLVLGALSFILKLMLGQWDHKRGDIFNSLNPFEAYQDYLEEKDSYLKLKEEKTKQNDLDFERLWIEGSA